MTQLPRRRFLAIAAAGALAPQSALAKTVHRRTGRALGAQTSLQIVNTSTAAAEATFTAVEQELARLERIFSLYDPASQLAALNGLGRLQDPAPELLEVLTLCTTLNKATNGAFDPTVQPLWAHHAGLASLDAAAARGLIGWEKVRIETNQIYFAEPGMQLTMNGIAQGCITDRVAALLRARGMTQVMIDMGEVVGLGRKADRTAWTAGVAAPDGRVVARVQLTDRALATSSTEGMMLDRDAKIGHILDPLQGQTNSEHRLVAISAPSAAVADGLSTAGCLLTKHLLQEAVGQFNKAEIEVYL